MRGAIIARQRKCRWDSLPYPNLITPIESRLKSRNFEVPAWPPFSSERHAIKYSIRTEVTSCPGVIGQQNVAEHLPTTFHDNG